MVLLADGVTIENRRKNVCQLADVSANSYPDADMDQKIENGDSIMLSFYNQEPTDTITKNMILVSDMFTAWLIRIGPGDNQNVTTAGLLEKMAMTIIKADNNTTDAEHKLFIGKSNGVDGVNPFS